MVTYERGHWRASCGALGTTHNGDHHPLTSKRLRRYPRSCLSANPLANNINNITRLRALLR
jgi:hypothetical protein